MWFKVDDQLPHHRKFRAVRRSHPTKVRDIGPMGLWSIAGAISNDGWIATEQLEDLDDDHTDHAARLVDAGFWVPESRGGEPGFRFHDWDVSNPGSSGAYGNHVKWHEQRGQVNPSCSYCVPGTPDGSPDDRGDLGASLGAISDPTRSPPDPTRPDPTAAAARGGSGKGSKGKYVPVPDLPVGIDILRSKLQRHTALRALRFDQLTPTRVGELEALVEVHGDQPLVEVALRTCGPTPPRSVAGFIGTWQSMPPPGQRLHVVTPRCPTHQTDLKAGVCPSCVADQRAGDR